MKKRWNRVQVGSYLQEHEIIIVEEILDKEVNQKVDLNKIATKISKCLGEESNKKDWQVILVNAPFGRKSLCSGKFYMTLQRDDGMMAFAWLNKLRKQYEKKSTLSASINF